MSLFFKRVGVSYKTHREYTPLTKEDCHNGIKITTAPQFFYFNIYYYCILVLIHLINILDTCRYERIARANRFKLNLVMHILLFHLISHESLHWHYIYCHIKELKTNLTQVYIEYLTVRGSLYCLLRQPLMKYVLCLPFGTS